MTNKNSFKDLGLSAKVLEAIRWMLEHKILKKDDAGNLTLPTQLDFESEI